MADTMVPLYLFTMASQPAVLDVLAALYVLAVLYVLYVLALLYVLAVIPVPAICLLFSNCRGSGHELLPNPTSSSRMLWCRGVIIIWVSTPQH